ncbi:MAG: hypothetical protein BalsKO_16240 [Balneolaceae bacterium]
MFNGMKNHIKSFLLIFLVVFTSCEKKLNPLIELINTTPELSTIATNSEYEVQIFYTQIDRDSLNQPHFITYGFGVDDNQYFYPASTVKFPAVLLALEKLNQLGISANARMEIDSAYSGQSEVRIDSSAPNLEPSVAHYSKKIMLVSDNDAFNRLYEFIGQDELNRSLFEKGYTNSKIQHRLSISLSKEENARTNPIRLYEGRELLHEQLMKVGVKDYSSSEPIKRGIGYYSRGELTNEPFDFSTKNFFPLSEQHQMVQAFIFPESFPESAFDLRPEDRAMVLKYGSIIPRDSEIEAYKDSTHYWDTYVKFLMYGSDPETSIPKNIRVFNKIGLAYGFSTDNAYIVDVENKVEFFLSVVINTNPNQIYNDNIYSYDEIAFPFLENLGQAIYQMELKRDKENSPVFESILID